jgi:transposase
MPPQRSVLSSISGNRAFNYQLSPYQRGKIIGLTYSGQKSTDIQGLLNVSRGAIYSTLKLDSLGLEGDTQLRSGRPKSYLEATEHKILQYI